MTDQIETHPIRVPLSKRILDGIYLMFTHRITTEEQARKFWSWFATMLATAFIASAYPTMLYVQATEIMAKLQIENSVKKSPDEFVKLRMFTINEIVYVVGTEAEYPRNTSEMAQEIKDLTVKVNQLKQVADAALEKANAHDRVLKKLVREK